MTLRAHPGLGLPAFLTALVMVAAGCTGPAADYEGPLPEDGVPPAQQPLEGQGTARANCLEDPDIEGTVWRVIDHADGDPRVWINSSADAEGGGAYIVRIPADATIIDARGGSCEPTRRDNVVRGTHVEASFAGPVTRSNPPQATAATLVLTTII